ncbi:MAG: trigger factor [Candidatus Eisenbacteria bacterium]|nr:trigger factor [Candidatus Eisenbacteria bacterium]
MVQVEVKDSGTWKKSLHVTVPAERVDQEFKRAVDKLQREVRLPGFRPGKVPRDMIRARFRDSLESDVIQTLVPAALREALQQTELEPVGEPSIRDLDADLPGPLSFRAEIEIWPRIELQGVEDLELEQELEPVGAEKVEESLEEIRQARADLVAVDRPSVQGDVLEGELIPVDVHGQRLPNLEVQPITLEVGSERLLPEFREATAGIAPGGERPVEVQYPEDYGNEELRGQKRRYRLVVKAIKEKKLRPLDDDFAREVDPEVDLEGLRARIRASLEAEAEREAAGELQRTLIDKLIQRNPFPLPDGMLRRGLEGLKGRMEKEGSRVSSDEFDQRFRPLVERLQRRQIILDAAAKTYGIEVTEEELQQHLEAMAQRNDMHVAKLRRMLESRGELERLREEMLEQKTLQVLLQKAKVHQYVKGGEKGERRTKGGIILPG